MDKLPIGTTIDPLGKTVMGGFAEVRDSSDVESRSVSTLERRIIKSPKICKQCQLNDDPNNVPVHPNCDCNVITDSITTNVADPQSRFLNVLKPDNIDISVLNGELPQGIQLNPTTVAIVNGDEVRWADFARWLEQMQPYLEAGDQYLSIVVDDDTDDAIDQLQELSDAAAEGTEELAQALHNRKLWFSLAKAVAF